MEAEDCQQRERGHSRSDAAPQAHAQYLGSPSADKQSPKDLLPLLVLIIVSAQAVTAAGTRRRIVQAFFCTPTRTDYVRTLTLSPTQIPLFAAVQYAMTRIAEGKDRSAPLLPSSKSPAPSPPSSPMHRVKSNAAWGPLAYFKRTDWPNNCGKSNGDLVDAAELPADPIAGSVEPPPAV